MPPLLFISDHRGPEAESALTKASFCVLQAENKIIAIESETAAIFLKNFFLISALLRPILFHCEDTARGCDQNDSCH